MKLKVKTPGFVVIGFTRRELLIINRCLNEACHGLIMDRFIPAHNDLLDMLDEVKQIAYSKDFFNLSPATA